MILHFRLTFFSSTIVPTSYAATGNRTHVSRVAPNLSDVLPTELHGRGISGKFHPIGWDKVIGCSPCGTWRRRPGRCTSGTRSRNPFSRSAYFRNKSGNRRSQLSPASLRSAWKRRLRIISSIVISSDKIFPTKPNLTCDAVCLRSWQGFLLTSQAVVSVKWLTVKLQLAKRLLVKWLLVKWLLAKWLLAKWLLAEWLFTKWPGLFEQ